MLRLAYTIESFLFVRSKLEHFPKEYRSNIAVWIAKHALYTFEPLKRWAIQTMLGHPNILERFKQCWAIQMMLDHISKQCWAFQTLLGLMFSVKTKNNWYNRIFIGSSTQIYCYYSLSIISNWKNVRILFINLRLMLG